MTETCRVDVTFNGKPCSADIDNRLLLVDLIRDVFDSKGTRVGCMTGDCGACTVLVDGEIAKSCLILAASANGREVTSIEGLRDIERLQQSFIAANGFQCGYCTSGMILVAADLLRRDSKPDRDKIKKAISGNLCRCTGYEAIVDAIYMSAHGKEHSGS
jgi:carbon-monoxide dehydrogenase small subunit